MQQISPWMWNFLAYTKLKALDAITILLAIDGVCSKPRWHLENTAAPWSFPMLVKQVHKECVYSSLVTVFASNIMK